MSIDPRKNIVNPLQNFKLTDRVRVLKDISDSIKNGTKSPSPHTSTEFYDHFSRRIRSTPKENAILGGDIILEEMGVLENIKSIKSYAPEVVFYAEDISKAMFRGIKDGNFKPENVDLNQFDIADFGPVATQAESSFDLSSIANGITIGANAITNAVDSVTGALNKVGCVPTYHAQTLLDQGIKYKFLFVVEFHWTPPHQTFQSDISFVVKDSTRPNITAEYEEINMYNFRTKVPKRTTYEPMTMNFYDDASNHAMKMWDAYQKALIPISNVGPPDESTSMKFSTGGAYDASVNAYTASYAPPPDGTTKDILSKINLFHVYDSGRKMNTFTFHNPRIEQFVLDNVDMTDGATGNEVQIQFSYDSLSVITDMGINGIGAVEAGGMSAGVGGNGSTVDHGSGFSAASTAIGSVGSTVGAIGSFGQAIGALGGAFGALTGQGNPLANISNKITGTASAIQGTVGQVQGVINLGSRGVQTLKSIAATPAFSSISNAVAKSTGAISGGIQQIGGLRTNATRAARQIGSILNI